MVRVGNRVMLGLQLVSSRFGIPQPSPTTFNFRGSGGVF